ncbi:hypothetical protein QP027_11970 [Corynebacterium breve]|uniref:Uncharacterized protein n=1 Tax=Corynebacterium breve TaxID=3049799 RepID=A0ABY8VE39_9CORY|nr:hypothetical protein [Corynebacterium breve]WIM67768.1 hypothetical protein QP027_11970 [Corynebacterium breve]
MEDRKSQNMTLVVCGLALNTVAALMLESLLGWIFGIVGVALILVAVYRMGQDRQAERRRANSDHSI